MKIAQWLNLSLLGLGLALGALAAENPRERLVKEIGAEALVNAAWKTHANFVKSGDREKSEVVPEKYWEDAIRKLKPVKVYLHRVNVVVVTKVADAAEEGLYIYIPISSYLPRDGDDGFRFKMLARDIQEHVRVRQAGPTLPKR